MTIEKKHFGFWRASKNCDYDLPWVEDCVDVDWIPTDLDRLLTYIKKSPIVIASGSLPTQCLLCNKMHFSSFKSDGQWLWPGNLSHYIERHHVKPSEGLLSHIRNNRYSFPEKISCKLEDLPWP